ncbi:spore coat assembly SafA domain protein [Piscirickettsia salmonis]|uniref:LysM peptidoglycan-binding domain-containing protein n=2 Tax=Piscirickettsia salmonis TaxID=1238 RepID=UPI0006BCD24B|nr:LysM peptidoglycan-binding domain-containing protein [Piscirickettsia salmonis]ALA24884.1 spore coat assembly protein SafA [Piscirickettsia salmonis]APS45197.1 spore coat assembly SafA domain protein [Piscirickettsia salmonis]APS48557.1 spore coat assembly SafA domain protein [Piscirickettsia salmonis]APS49815.1 spore coat assembly SafA domain protein [Piscirickettsia salmonis]APS53001.1 spore coat assembly SafA domain protein [Piscirickettsia salmonis]
MKNTFYPSATIAMLALTLAACTTTSTIQKNNALQHNQAHLASKSTAAYAVTPISNSIASLTPITPIENLAAGPITEDPDVELWQRIRQHFSLNHYNNIPRVQYYIHWYLKHAKDFNTSIERATPFLYYIVEQVEERHMPMEIALLPLVESGFRPSVSSSAGASGLWQLMPITASRFGVKQNWWYDGRFDIGKSTRSALNYLLYLHNFFDGNWLLALAAYNSGEGTVQQAITKNMRAHKPTAYWNLALPRETRDYVPKLLAAAAIIANPETYHINIPQIENKPQIMPIDMGGQVNLAQVAKYAGISVDEVNRLNPGYTRLITSPKGPHILWLPIAAAKRLESHMNQHPKKQLLSWHRYRVQPGDTISAIASKLDIPTRMLSEVNQLNGHLIYPGQFLLYPAPKATHHVKSNHNSPKSHVATANSTRTAAPKLYTVRSGDSLWEISKRYRIHLADLKKWNPAIQSQSLHIGQTLHLQPTVSTKTKHQLITHKSSDAPYFVQAGDSISTIAQKFNISTDQLKTWNNLKSSHIYPKQKLLVNAPKATMLTYKVKSRDTLYRISQLFDVNVSDIMYWNHLSNNNIHPGQQLKIAQNQENHISKVAYKVRNGDTLYSISRHYDTTVANLQHWNKLSSNSIKTGQALTIYTDTA